MGNKFNVGDWVTPRVEYYQSYLGRSKEEAAEVIGQIVSEDDEYSNILVEFPYGLPDAAKEGWHFKKKKPVLVAQFSARDWKKTLSPASKEAKARKATIQQSAEEYYAILAAQEELNDR